MKPFIKIAVVMLLIFAVPFSLSACGTLSGTASDTVDSHGFTRPDSAFLTESIVLSKYPKSIDELWGTGGESGLASDIAVSRDTVSSPTSPIYVCYLIYANSFGYIDNKNYKTDFSISRIKDMEVTKDGESGVTPTIVATTGNISATLDMSLPSDQRLKISSDGYVMDGAILFRFTVDDPSDSTLFLNIELNTGDASYLTKHVDSHDEIHIGGNAEASSNYLETGNVSVGYVSAADYNGGDYDPSSVKSTQSFDGGDCYMVLGFDIIGRSGSGKVKVFTYVADRGLLAATIEEAPTGKIEEITTNNTTKIYATYSSPAAGETKSVSMTIRLRAISNGKCDLDIFMIGDNENQVSGSTHVTVPIDLGEPTIKYTVSADKTYYTVSELADKNATSISIPDTLNDGLPVLYIADGVFKGNTKITSVSIGNNVTSIPADTFNGCTALKSVSIGSGVEFIGTHAFMGCTALKEVYYNAKACSDYKSESNIFTNAAAFKLTVGAGVSYVPTYMFAKSPVGEVAFEKNGVCVEIGSNAFSSCQKLTRVEIISKSISASAFFNCPSLSIITLSGNVTTIGKSVFGHCGAITEINYDVASSPSVYDPVFGTSKLAGATVNVGKNAKVIPYALFKDTEISAVNFDSETVCESIGGYAFYGCKNLTTITLPESLVKVDSYAFACSALESIVTPSGMKVIGEMAFYHCESMTSADIRGAEKIYESAFWDCKSLATVHLNAGIKTVYSWVFSGCTINELHYAGSLEDWCQISFSDALIRDVNSFFTKEGKVVDIVIGDGPTQISNNAFAGYYGLRSVTLRSSTLTSIGKSAFASCKGLTSLVIDSPNLTLIGETAFSTCQRLSSVTLGEGITTISKNAFAACDVLYTVALPSSITRLEQHAFSSSKISRIDYAGTVDQWRAIKKDSGWISYSIVMQAIVYCYDGTYGA